MNDVLEGRITNQAFGTTATMKKYLSAATNCRLTNAEQLNSFKAILMLERYIRSHSVSHRLCCNLLVVKDDGIPLIENRSWISGTARTIAVVHMDRVRNNGDPEKTEERYILTVLEQVCRIKANDSMDLSEDTIMSYIKALKRIFVIEDCEAWSPNLRSKTAIRTSDTRYFVDPSIATAALGVGPGDLINDLNTCGLLFETLCMRDLRVFADFLQGEVRHFRTKEGLECDAVVHLRNGSYGLIEIKLGGDKLIEEGAKTLKAVRDKIDTTKMKNPSFLMVLTGNSPFAYRRNDGVYVVPIGCLRQ